MILTERLVLRLLDRDDVDRLVELDADPEVMRFISGGVPTTRAEYDAGILDRFLVHRREDPERGFFGAWLGDAFAGWFHLRPDVFEPAWLEVGYRLHRRYWGTGLATEGTRALIAHARRDEPEVVISARAMAGNAASRRVMEKCGLVFAGDFTWPSRTVGGRTYPEIACVLYRTPDAGADDGR